MSRDREPLPTRVRDLPPLPSAYGERLAAGLEALDLDLAPGARTVIDDHLRLLLAWTGAINLTSVRDPVAAATLHILDSLTAVRLVRDLGGGRLLDLGSGGGYPGIPLAAAVPADALLVESTVKKARFLEVAVIATGLVGRVGVAASRSEELVSDPAQREAWPIVTARAVADLGRLVELSFPHLAPGGSLIAWKRGDLAAELERGETAARRLGGGRLTVIQPDLPNLPGHVLVRVERSGPLPAVAPRHASRAARDQRPT